MHCSYLRADPDTTSKYFAKDPASKLLRQLQIVPDLARLISNATHEPMSSCRALGAASGKYSPLIHTIG